MKKWVKVLLIILLILVILVAGVAAYGYHTYKQIKDVMAAVEKNKAEDIDSLMKGDCSKLSVVGERIADAEAKISVLCDNLAVKIAISGGWIPKNLGIINQEAAKNICIEIKNPNNAVEKNLAQIRTYCANQTAVKS